MSTPISERHQYLGMNDKPFKRWGIPTVGLCLTVVEMKGFPWDFPKEFLVYFMITCLYTWLFWTSMSGLTIQFRRWFAQPESTVKRLVLQTGAAVVLTYLMSRFFCLFPDEWLGVKQMANHGMNEEEMFGTSLMITLFIMAIYEILFMFSLWKNTRLEAEKLKQMTTQAQLDSLKSQVNPHFLFNSLNTLVALIPEDPKMAVEFVRHLSQVYRFVLDVKDKNWVSWQEEQPFLTSYLFLLHIRFGEKLKVLVEIPENAQVHLVPMAMQLLIENAIKHNEVSSERPLQIRVTLDDQQRIVVVNPLQVRNAVESNTG